MEELKKCPFCGEEVEIDKEFCWEPSFYNPDGRDGIFMHYVKCKKCGTTTKLRYTKNEAIKARNRRVEE